MEIILLILLLLVFLLPSFLMMRKQRRNQAEVQTFQNALQPGDEVVTVSGLHGSIVGIGETSVELEIAPGVPVTVEKMSVIRYQNTGMIGTAESAGSVGYTHPEAQPDEQRGQHPAEPPYLEDRDVDGPDQPDTRR